MSWTDERVETLKRMWNEGFSATQIAKELGGVTRNAVIGKVHRLGFSKRGAAAEKAPAEARAKGAAGAARDKAGAAEADKPDTGKAAKPAAEPASVARPDAPKQAAAAESAPEAAAAPSVDKTGAPAATEARGAAETADAAPDQAAAEAAEAAAAPDETDTAESDEAAPARANVPPRRPIITAGKPLPPQPSLNEISPESLATAREVEKRAARISLMELTERTCKWPIGDPATPDFWFCGLPAQAGKPYCEAHVGVAFQPMSARRDRRRR